MDGEKYNNSVTRIVGDKDNVIRVLSEIRDVCSYTRCRDCLLYDVEDGCMFYSKPFDWDISEVETSIHKNKKEGD